MTHEADVTDGPSVEAADLAEATAVTLAGRLTVLRAGVRSWDHGRSTSVFVAKEIGMTNTRRDRPPSLGELRSRRSAVLEIARRHGVLDIRVFGSVARGDADRDTVTSTSWSNWSPVAASRAHRTAHDRRAGGVRH